MVQLRHYSGTVFGKDLEDMGDGYLTNHNDLHIWQSPEKVDIVWSTFSGEGTTLNEAWQQIQTKARQADDEFCLNLRRWQQC